MKGMKRNEGSKKLYYISAEFLIGKLLSNNLINLGVFEETRQVLKKYGHDLTAVEEVELEPSLGNGGLDVYKRQGLGPGYHDRTSGNLHQYPAVWDGQGDFENLCGL